MEKVGRKSVHGFAKRGVKRPREYNSWLQMIGRCTNPNHARFGIYGAKGITVCDRWRKFENFLEDMGKAPSDIHTLDRYPNQKGNYEPGNARWATPTQQGRNTSKNRIVTYNGESLCVSEWAERLKVNSSVIFNRLDRYGWSVKKTLTTPVQDRLLNLMYRPLKEPEAGNIKIN